MYKISILSIFLNLSKAFEAGSYTTLLVKLNKCGVRGKEYEINESYLCDREQKVEIYGISSESQI